jgi:hypothetical protein
LSSEPSMSSKELDNLVKAGTLKAEPGDQKEFDGLVDSGRKRLIDARKQGLSPESQFDLAYGAAHAFSLAALRWHGYRPNKSRFVVFQALQHTLHLKPAVWRAMSISDCLLTCWQALKLFARRSRGSGPSRTKRGHDVGWQSRASKRGRPQPVGLRWPPPTFTPIGTQSRKAREAGFMRGNAP